MIENDEKIIRCSTVSQSLDTFCHKVLNALSRECEEIASSLG